MLFTKLTQRLSACVGFALRVLSRMHSMSISPQCAARGALDTGRGAMPRPASDSEAETGTSCGAVSNRSSRASHSSSSSCDDDIALDRTNPISDVISEAREPPEQRAEPTRAVGRSARSPVPVRLAITVRRDNRSPRRSRTREEEHEEDPATSRSASAVSYQKNPTK